MILDLNEVARAMQAGAEAPHKEVRGWSVDTRTLEPGDVYFALRGPNFDGHDFVRAAEERGAAAVVVCEAPLTRRRGGAETICVDDTLAALQRAGAWARNRWGGAVVGVTGSAGKTTTKDAIAHLLSVGFSVGRTAGNLNNHVGVPLSILRLPDDSRIGVLEMGMNHAGEIRALAGIAKPEIGVVTNVGYAHIEFFDSIEGIATAKRELIESLPVDGTAVLNADDPRVVCFREVHPGKSVTFGLSATADLRGCDVEFRADGTRFRVCGVEFQTPLSGRHAVQNLLAAIAVAGVMGIAPEKLKEAVASFAVGQMRGERLEHKGIVIWNDCYNSNPEAARSMIDVLQATPAKRRIAVLGEMLELGSASAGLHREVGRYAVQKGIDLVIGVRGYAGELADAAGPRGRFFAEALSAGEFARSEARPGDAVLFKGSRGVKMEQALERFLA